MKAFRQESIFEVISCGDFNQCNMMYAREGDNTRVLFVDFQVRDLSL
jgi:hypothetical protein